MNTTFEDGPAKHKPISAYTDAIVSNARLVVLDNKCTITWANDKFCKLTQYEAHELIGKHIGSLSLTSLRVQDFKAIHAVISFGREWTGEIKSKTKSGSTLWLKTNISPILGEHGKISAYLVLCSNITATKTALGEKEEALDSLMRNEARYRALVEYQSDLMSLCNAEGVRIFVNDKFCEFMGKPRHELIGTNALDYPLRGLSAGLIRRKREEITPSNPDYSGIFELEDSLGEKVWMSIYFRGIFDAQGKLFEVLTIGRDVTALKTAEVSMSKYIGELEHIAFMTAHRVRAPIATMLGLLELLKMNCIQPDQWDTVLVNFKKCIVDLDRYSRELGDFVHQSQCLREKDIRAATER